MTVPDPSRNPPPSAHAPPPPPPPGPGPTEALYRAARDGSREAYDRLFARATENALLFVRLRLGPGLRSEADSLDVLQDAWLETHRDFDRFTWQGEASFAR